NRERKTSRGLVFAAVPRSSQPTRRRRSSALVPEDAAKAPTASVVRTLRRSITRYPVCSYLRTPCTDNATAQRPERATASSGPLKRLVRGTLLLTAPVMGQHTLLDHLVGALYEGLRNREAEGLGGLQVDHQLELAGLLHGEVAGPGAFQDLVHVDGRAAE